MRISGDKERRESLCFDAKQEFYVGGTLTFFAIEQLKENILETQCCYKSNMLLNLPLSYKHISNIFIILYLTVG